MRVHELHGHVEKEPFKPFRLYVSDGSSYEIRTPHHVIVTHSEITIGLDPDESGIPRRSVYIDPIHVTRVAIIESNGKRGKRRRR
jgi:hypothetical protein